MDVGEADEPNVESFLPDTEEIEEANLQEMINDDLTYEEKEEWIEMLSSFKSTVSEAGDPAKVVMFVIELDGIPKCFPPRRIRSDLESKVKEKITKLLEKGFIKPSVSPVVSPMVIVPKRMISDYV
ncbi:hypothetical protein ADUPG1_001601 [Aduncisulcus paluster]|uniref:Reverse transcriptase n=1 Tax=Aduncisulcus paluster TaxID=2918883 RepID=A0ABQ5KGT0_9EUKA|nr:hypothetical protein ADUPG1_001601 [Aduncisulcus paluster]